MVKHFLLLSPPGKKAKPFFFQIAESRQKKAHSKSLTFAFPVLPEGQGWQNRKISKYHNITTKSQMERWLSGRKRLIANPLYEIPSYRGFESLSLRILFYSLLFLPSCQRLGFFWICTIISFHISY